MSSTHSACAPLYYHLWPVRLYHIFPTLSHKRHDFRGKKSLNIKCVLILSTFLCPKKKSHSKKKSARYCHKCARAFVLTAPCSGQILTLIQLTWKYGELLILPADGRLDLIRRLTLIQLTWKIWWAPNNTSRWQMGFNSAFNPYTANVENTVSS